MIQDQIDRWCTELVEQEYNGNEQLLVETFKEAGLT